MAADWDLVAKINKNAANHIETAASIASGHGEYGLANQLWVFESKLRAKAREARAKHEDNLRPGAGAPPAIATQAMEGSEEAP